MLVFNHTDALKADSWLNCLIERLESVWLEWDIIEGIR